ncbi:hypothetical protein MUDAN_BIHEEGNE_00562 [Lactiplantibacillus mudanjiangensis]|uniref:hypothetical protein n=1 Tax=Lactiplantibacillus mudanjiangensis TaxID=1296538 RepID=UPI00101463AC|nr:hypothetical protein MUDAN_BIHEEGNE_00562 [Lactiplantibacillus mudanjiangensis]
MTTSNINHAKELLKEFRHLFRQSNLRSIVANEVFILQTLPSENNNSIVTEVQSIITAINKLNTLERSILYWKYINIEELTNVGIWLELCVGERTFYRKLKLAHQHFSEAYSNSSIN